MLQAEVKINIRQTTTDSAIPIRLFITKSKALPGHQPLQGSDGPQIWERRPGLGHRSRVQVEGQAPCSVSVGPSVCFRKVHLCQMLESTQK